MSPDFRTAADSSVSDWLEMECTPSGTTVDMSFNLSA
jgi:hypothetical protein